MTVWIEGWDFSKFPQSVQLLPYRIDSFREYILEHAYGGALEVSEFVGKVFRNLQVAQCIFDTLSERKKRDVSVYMCSSDFDKDIYMKQCEGIEFLDELVSRSKSRQAFLRLFMSGCLEKYS